MVNIQKSLCIDRLGSRPLLSEIGGGMGIIDVVVSRNYENPHPMVCKYLQLPGKRLMGLLLAV